MCRSPFATAPVLKWPLNWPDGAHKCLHAGQCRTRALPLNGAVPVCAQRLFALVATSVEMIRAVFIFNAQYCLPNDQNTNAPLPFDSNFE